MVSDSPLRYFGNRRIFAKHRPRQFHNQVFEIFLINRLESAGVFLPSSAQTVVVVMLVARMTCAAFADHNGLTFAAYQFSRQNKFEYIFFTTGRVLIRISYFLNTLPSNIVNYRGINVRINRIAVLYLAVVLRIAQHFVNIRFIEILSFLCAYAAVLQVCCYCNTRKTLRKLRKNLFYYLGFNGIDDVFLIYNVVTVNLRAARIISFKITLVQTTMHLLT